MFQIWKIFKENSQNQHKSFEFKGSSLENLHLESNINKSLSFNLMILSQNQSELILDFPISSKCKA